MSPTSQSHCPRHPRPHRCHPRCRCPRRRCHPRQCSRSNRLCSRYCRCSHPLCVEQPPSLCSLSLSPSHCHCEHSLDSSHRPCHCHCFSHPLSSLHWPSHRSPLCCCSSHSLHPFWASPFCPLSSRAAMTSSNGSLHPLSPPYSFHCHCHCVLWVCASSLCCPFCPFPWP